MDEYTEEELALLTEEERAALNEPDTVEEDEPELEEKPVELPKEEPKPEPVKTEPEQPVVAEEPKPKPEPEKTEPEQPAITPRPRGVLNDTLPEDWQQRVDQNAAAAKELRKKYNDGDISFDEYEDGREKLSDEKQDLRDIKMRAEIADQSASVSLQQSWDNAMGSFLGEHPEAISSDVRRNAFDHILREVTAPIMAAGGMPGRAEIEKAYDIMAKEFGLEGKKPDPKVEAEEAKQPNKIPPVLGGLPAASSTATEDGRWAQLDRLMDSDPLAHEEALGKLSTADYDAYMASR